MQYCTVLVVLDADARTHRPEPATNTRPGTGNPQANRQLKTNPDSLLLLLLVIYVRHNGAVLGRRPTAGRSPDVGVGALAGAEAVAPEEGEGSAAAGPRVLCGVCSSSPPVPRGGSLAWGA